MTARSYMRHLAVPSAVISDGVLIVPLWAVTTIGLNEAYKLPPIGSSTAKAVVATHDDTLSLSGVLVGPERYGWKLALASFSDGAVSGLIVVTAMTIRTDMQVQTLSFSASAGKRDALDVAISLAHMPRPGSLGKLLDVTSIGVGVLADAVTA